MKGQEKYEGTSENTHTNNNNNPSHTHTQTQEKQFQGRHLEFENKVEGMSKSQKVRMRSNCRIFFKAAKSSELFRITFRN